MGVSKFPAALMEHCGDPSSGSVPALGGSVSGWISQDKMGDGEQDNILATNHVCTTELVKMASTTTVEGPKCWDSCGESGDILGICIARLPYFEDVIRAKLVSKYFKEYIESDAFCRARGIARPVEASLTSLLFFIEDGHWHFSGFDLASGRWKRLHLTCLPTPRLNQQNLVAGGGGLFCVNVSQITDEEMLIVCNPLTQEKVMLPPLHSRRNPVLMHLLPNPATNSYKVIVAGSSSDTGDGLSTRTEVFDSLLWQWTKTGDIPGYDFFLNEYQTGVCKDGILYCVGFLKAFANGVDPDSISTRKKGVLAYGLETGEWLGNWIGNLPLETGETAHVAQLVECNKDIYLFLEYLSLLEEKVVQLIAKLETFARPGGAHVVAKWKTVVTRTIESHSRCAVPEFTCVPYGVGKLCIFNTVEHTGVVYDILSPREEHEEALPPPPATPGGYGFHSLNPLSFTFQLSFSGKCVSRSHSVMKGKARESKSLMSDPQEYGRKRVCLEIFPEFKSDYLSTEDDQICSLLPDDLLIEILVRCEYEVLSRMRLASKLTKKFVEDNCFQVLRGVLSTLHFMVKDGVWQGSGFHLTLKKWMRLPNFSSPLKAVSSSEDGSEDYLIAGGGGLLCLLNVSDSNGKRLVIVYNPLTMKVRVLPVIKFCRNPVLMHLLSNPQTMTYKVIVAGNPDVEGEFPICSGIFDSMTSEWTTTYSNLGPDFTLSQYQTGACVGRILYCIADCQSEERNHVLQCNVETGEWLDWSIPVPHPERDATRFLSVYIDVQLVECDDSIYLFSRRGLGDKEQRLHKLVLGGRAEHQWKHVWSRPEEIGRYPAYTCTPFGDHKLCVFNTNEVAGEVYDNHDHSFSELPSPLKRICGMSYDIQNHLGFTIQPGYEQQP